MALHIYHRYLLVVICIALIHASGLPTGFSLPPLRCGEVLSNCDNAICNQSCGTKGGSCYEVARGAFTCCCPN
ncbi:hypothetical protein VNO77_19481 [Canavalia gladiata]|uniref:LCR n=1 Tax=Canavalia gladiata TaxID=3824 RepID=A0AAN9LMQ7_CANGL